MGWERGRYYTRSRKVNGRVVRHYIGGGEVGELLAEHDQLKREIRQNERDARTAEREHWNELDAAVSDLCDLADLLARAALLAAGYHQHKRGAWRERRVHRTPDRC